MKRPSPRNVFGGILGGFFLMLAVLSTIAVILGWASETRDWVQTGFLIFEAACGLVSLATGVYFLSGNHRWWLAIKESKL